MTNDSTKTPLRLWLDQSTYSDKEFAELVELSAPAICNIAKGVRAPSYTNARRISAATGGAVRVPQLIDPVAVAERRRLAAANARPRPRRGAEGASA